MKPTSKRDRFIWGVGIEDTFITAPHPRTRRTLDEYELTGHYAHWRRDLDLMASLGVTHARYGVPWHRLQPSRRKWNWSFADATLSRLLDLGIQPVVDLIHYGLPRWIDGAYLHPDYAKFVSEYAARLAERFKGRIKYYTPLNEPRITAWYCGRLGWWPPCRRGWGGFVAVMLAACRGIVSTTRALKDVDRNIVPVYVDAADVYSTSDPSLKDEVRRRQEIGFLALDLITGRVERRHALFEWLIRHGADESQLDGFRAHPTDVPLVGVNLYPMFSNKVLVRCAGGRIRAMMVYADASLVERVVQLYWRRYRRPVFIAETASVGSVARRMKWLNDSTAAVARLRKRGVPVVGYTWWPMFALVTWAYRQGTRDPAAYLKQMGLWDLRRGGGGELARVATPLVARYRDLVRQPV